MINLESVFYIKFGIKTQRTSKNIDKLQKASITFFRDVASNVEKREDLHIWTNRYSAQMLHQEVTLRLVSSACD